MGSEKSVLLLRTKAEIFDGNPAVPLFVVFVCMCVCVFAFDMCRKKNERKKKKKEYIQRHTLAVVFYINLKC